MLTLNCLTNGTWVAIAFLPSGATVTVDAPSPADAALAVLQALGIDNLASFVANAKSQQTELSELKLEYDGMLQVMDSLHKNVKAVAQKLHDDWEGHERKELVKELQQLVAPWPSR